MTTTRAVRTTVILALVLAVGGAALAAGAGKSPVSVPPDTKLMTIKYGDDTEAKLKSEEQVAFLIVYGIWNLEDACLDESGAGRLCTLEELARGVRTQGGGTIGLKVDPGLDTNYTYDVTIVGDSCMIRAVPRVAGLGAFGMAGSLLRGGSNFYYNPKGPDLVAGTVKLTEYGYEGNGFRR
jgi:hypothetical protein